MRTFPAAFALFGLVMWGGAASAGCVSQMQCDDSGVCRQVQSCDNAVDVVQPTPAAMTSIPAELDPATPSAVVSAAQTGSNCQRLNLCGTWKTVCR